MPRDIRWHNLKCLDAKRYTVALSKISGCQKRYGSTFYNIYYIYLSAKRETVAQSKMLGCREIYGSTIYYLQYLDAKRYTVAQS